MSNPTPAPEKNQSLSSPVSNEVGYNYGRLPEDLRPIFAKLTHLEMHVYSMLTISAIRSKKDPDVGCVNISKSALAREMGIDPKSIRVAVKGLIKAGLLTKGRVSCPKGWGVIPHYLGHEHLPPRVSSPSQSPQPQLSIEGYEPPRGSEEVSEEEVKRKRGKRASKDAPPHPLSGLVWWDKEKREVLIEPNGYGLLIAKLATLSEREGLAHRLSDSEWQEGWGRLNGHLMGNPFKTNRKTLPAIVLNWFETDLRRKNNHPQRGKPLAQRIDDKARERMNRDGEQKSSTSLPDPFIRLLKPGRERYNR